MSLGTVGGSNPPPDSAGLVEFTLPTREELSKLAVGVNAGGLTARFNRLSPSDLRKQGLTRRQAKVTGGFSNFDVTSSPERQALVGGIADSFRGTADELRGVLPQIAPGFSNFRKAQLDRIRDARLRTVGNLSETLSRRRVRGSSFADDSIARTEAEFSRQEADTEAATRLEELRLTTQYIQEIGNLDRQAFSTNLMEMNVQADLATKLALSTQQVATQAANIATQVSIAQAQIDAANYQAGLASDGSGELLGSVIGGAATVGAAALGPA